MVTLGSCKVPCAHSSLHIAPVLPASLFGRLSLVTTTMQIDLGAAMSQMSDMEHEMQSHEGCRCVLLVVWVIAGGGACCVLGRSASGEFVLRAVLLALHGCRHNMLCCAVCRVVCRVIGDISVRRVAGKLHFAVHQQSFVDVLPQVGMGCCVVCGFACCLDVLEAVLTYSDPPLLQNYSRIPSSCMHITNFAPDTCAWRCLLDTHNA